MAYSDRLVKPTVILGCPGPFELDPIVSCDSQKIYCVSLLSGPGSFSRPSHFIAFFYFLFYSTKG